jgi:orotidine-5'-phosphate decarboxylase
MTDIPRAERLIVALDVATPAEARALVEKLGDAARFYKVGLELFMAGGYFELVDWLAARGNKVFVDLKFFDVPETVRRAVANLRGRDVSFATVHGNQAMMEAAAKEKGEVKILAVTVLTSLDRGDLDDLGFSCDIERLVLSRARRAIEAGCDGVISSGAAQGRVQGSAAGRHARDSPGRQPPGRRPEAHGRRRAGVCRGRRLHRGGTAHPAGRGAALRRARHPGHDR